MFCVTSKAGRKSIDRNVPATDLNLPSSNKRILSFEKAVFHSIGIRVFMSKSEKAKVSTADFFP